MPCKPTVRSWSLNVVLSAAVVPAAISCAQSAQRFMALNDQTSTVDLTEESLALMTVRTSNPYRPTYQPGIVSVHIDRESTKGRQSYIFSVPSRWQLRHRPDYEVKNQYMEYLISLSLPPGKYVLTKISGYGGRMAPVHYGIFRIPVFSSFDIEPHSAVYLGCIDAAHRKRQEDTELRSGPAVPFADQAISGFAGGTFDVKITDCYERDVARFKRKYPALNTHVIRRAVLTPAEQPSTEEWNWEVMK